MKQQKNKKKSSKWFGILLVVIGLLVVSYPVIAQAWNRGKHTVATVDYDNTTQAMSDEDIESYLGAADAYNDKLQTLEYPLVNAAAADGYDDLLNVMGNGIMGYIEIPAIDVRVPIYHYADATSISEGVGHMVGTSLPVGGEGTHAVLSSHTGMPSARLFTDLPKLKVGDIFTITVLNRKCTYRIDQIETVLPTETDPFETIDPNGDYVTLVTCVPYGINTHRLLVRGTRVDGVDATSAVLRADYRWIRILFVTGVVALAVVSVWQGLIIYAEHTDKRRNAKHNHDGRSV